jgi:hypothetical protein
MRERLSAVRWIRDHWLAVQVSTTAAAVLQVTLLVQALSRGLDYMTLPDDVSVATLSVIERAVPIWLSGWMFAGAALLGLAGLVLPRWPVTTSSHAVIATFYAMFAVGALVEVLQRDPVQGWRTPTAWVVGAIAHGVFCQLSATSWRVTRAS